MNILLITADQWRGECLSCLDHPVVKTPNLDALAAQGVLFKKHYAQATPCGPSRTSLHTGMYMFNHRSVKNGTPVSNRFTNWALETRKHGYDPSLFGYTDTGMDPAGIDHADSRLKHYSEPLPGIGYYTQIKNDVSVPWVEYLKRKQYEIPATWKNVYGNKAPGTAWADGGERVLPLAISAEDHETRFMVDECIRWINVQPNAWITHLSLFRPHPPFVAPEPYNEMYAVDDMTRPVRHDNAHAEAAQHPFLPFAMNRPLYHCPDNERLLQERQVAYYGLMSEVDDSLGRLFEFLKRSDQWDNTLIIFTSDHGEQMGDHWLMGKQGFYDSSYHIPLIVRDPREAASETRGSQKDTFTENIDIMPTMLDWLAAETPSQCDGRSLLPCLYSNDTPPSWRKEVYWEHDFRDVLHQTAESALGINSHLCNLSVVRDDEYKYVHFAALPPLLFDLKNDPHELNNCADDPQYQKIVLAYAQKLLSWRMRYADRALTETFLSDQGPVTVRQSP